MLKDGHISGGPTDQRGHSLAIDRHLPSTAMLLPWWYRAALDQGIQYPFTLEITTNPVLTLAQPRPDSIS